MLRLGAFARRADRRFGTALERGAPAAHAVGLQTLRSGFEAQAAGRYDDALAAYVRVQSGKSPLLQALASNAESLLLARTAVKIAAPLRASTAEDAGSEAQTQWSAFEKTCVPGDLVLAPWAEDGNEYLARIKSVDVASMECTLDWDDGGDTHTVVPLAAVTAVDGGTATGPALIPSAELRLWTARRSMRDAVGSWGAWAEAGTGHDAFVDAAGLLCDAAAAETRVAFAASGCWLAPGLESAYRHLKRARWMVERAYAPDSRALAVICMHRAELMRLGVAGTAPGPGGKAPAGVAHVTRSVIQDSLVLHQQVAAHLNAAKWSSAASQRWQRPDGNIPFAALHELLWAKALASQALEKRSRPIIFLPNVKARSARGARSRASPQRCLHGPRRKFNHPRGGLAATAGSVLHLSPLPEKLVPSRPGLPSARDLLLQESLACAALGRTWRSLLHVAGVGSPAMPWDASPAQAQQLAELVATRGSRAGQRMLLEASVLTLAMGCSLGRPAWARSIALPLAEVAAAQLSDVDAADDAPAAARHTAAAISALAHPWSPGGATPPAADFSTGRKQLVGGKFEEAAGADRASWPQQRPGAATRWRLSGYDPTQECWSLRLGSAAHVNLFAPAPLTWCPEGLALSETVPKE